MLLQQSKASRVTTMDYDPDCLDQAHLAARMDAGLTGTSPEPDKAAAREAAMAAAPGSADLDYADLTRPRLLLRDCGVLRRRDAILPKDRNR